MIDRPEIDNAHKQLNGESLREHAVYLIYACSKMYKIAPIAKKLGLTYSAIRCMSKKNHWEDRVLPIRLAGDEAKVHVIATFAEKYHTFMSGVYQEAMKLFSTVPYPDIEAQKRQREAEDQSILASRASPNETALDNARYARILRMAQDKLFLALEKGTRTVTVAELRELEKMRTDAQRREREAKLMENAPKETVAQSDRVLRARAAGKSILPALQEDFDELKAILKGLQAQQEVSPQTLPLRRAG